MSVRWHIISFIFRLCSCQMVAVAPSPWPSGQRNKKLFPEIRTTKNFRGTKRRILQELQSNFKRKAIRNLSSYQLSPNEIEVLALGLNFVPTPSDSTHHLVQKSASHLTQTREKQFHFKNHPLTIKRPKYCKPSTWVPRESNSTNLSLFVEQIQGSLPDHPQDTKRPSLTAEVYL